MKPTQATATSRGDVNYSVGRFKYRMQTVHERFFWNLVKHDKDFRSVVGPTWERSVKNVNYSQMCGNKNLNRFGQVKRF